jgi:hypothetical protein
MLNDNVQGPMTMPWALSRPADTEYAPFFAGYVSLVPEPDVLRVLEEQPDEVRVYASTVAPERELFSYAPGKWSLRELFGHVADTERVFGYRALCISRGEQASLPGFDEQEYAAKSGAARSPLRDLVHEFVAIRESNLALLRRLDREAWERVGIANGNPVSVRALAYILAGHVRHHLAIVRSRYS